MGVINGLLWSKLMWSIIMVESHYNPIAINPDSGATGLMQLTPIGVEEVRIQYDLPNHTPDLFNPEVNKFYGSRLFYFYLKQTNGKIDEALVLYNGGYVALHAYRRGKPYKESRDYVKKVCKLFMHCKLNGRIWYD